MTSKMGKLRLRRLLLAVASVIVVPLVSCGGSGGLGPSIDRWYVTLSQYFIPELDRLESTLRGFSILVNEDICTGVNAAGVPVPDRIVFYPDGIGGPRAPVEVNLDSGEQVTTNNPHFKLEYDYGDRDEHRAVVRVFHGGEVSETSDIVGPSYLLLFDREVVESEDPERPRRAFDLYVDPHICTGTNANGAPIPDRVIFYLYRWDGELEPIEIDLSTGIAVPHDWTMFSFEYTFPDTNEWSVAVKVFYGAETKECRFRVGIRPH